jgi:protein ImuB
MFAAIFIPNFSLQAVLRADPDSRSLPVALVDPELSGKEILQCTPSAEHAGVTGGLTPAQAMARCHDLKILARSRAQEKSATEILLQTAFSFSPNIELTSLGVCTIEMKRLGLQGKAEMQARAGKIVKALARFDLDAKIGIAPTPELALLAAQSGETISVIEAVETFVTNLPISCLQPPPEIAGILSRWGIQTVGQFLGLGKNDVGARLGAEALELFKLVSRESVRPLTLVSPPEHFSEQIEFEKEVETLEPLIFVLNRFVEQLTGRLEALYWVIGVLELNLGLSSGEQYRHTFKIPSPTGKAEILFRMLQTHLEGVRTNSSIGSLQLVAIPARAETHQFGLFENTLKDPNQFAETLARLTALAGQENVGTPVPEASYQPDAFKMQQPNFDSVSDQTSNIEMGSVGLQLRRFRPPLPAHLEFQDGNPVRVHAQNLDGAVADMRGPYFSSGNWWDDNRWAREEWDVETAGGLLLRIFRSGEGCFVEGIYD